MKSLILITSQWQLGEALRQVAEEMMGIVVDVLPCKRVLVQPYGDVWIRGRDGYFSVSSELRRRWAAGEASGAIIGFLGERYGRASPRLFTAFLRRFCRCLLPVIGIETRNSVNDPQLPAQTYAHLPKMSLALLFKALRDAPTDVSPEIGTEAEQMVSARLWRVLTHDIGTMANRALAASSAGSLTSPDVAARGLLIRYQDLRLSTSFLHASPACQHLLPEIALEGLERACQTVMRGGALLDKRWHQQIEDYNEKFALAIEGWH